MSAKIFGLIIAIVAFAASVKGGYDASVEMVDAIKAFKEKPEEENTGEKAEELE